MPTHFAKVVLTSKPSSPKTPDVPEISTGAFVLPNAVSSDDAKLESFVVPVEAVERAVVGCEYGQMGTRPLGPGRCRWPALRLNNDQIETHRFFLFFTLTAHPTVLPRDRLHSFASSLMSTIRAAFV